MPKKKNAYGEIQEEFVEQRAENRGWDQLSVGDRQRLANRFDVLAASVEGRGKIARLLLPEAPQEERRALRQKIRKNIPQKSGSIGQQNETTPQATNLNTPSARGDVYRGAGYRPPSYVPPATTTTTSRANVKRVTGEFGSTYQPSAAINWLADTKIPVLGDLIGPGIPVARVIRQGARELDEAYMAFKQGEVTEGLKNVAGVGRELAYGAFDAGLVRVGTKGALGLGAKALGKIGAKGLAGRAITAADKIYTGGSIGAYRQGRAESAARLAVNETRPVVSSVERTVAAPEPVRTPVTGPATREPKIKGAPSSRRTSTRKSTPTPAPQPAPATASPVKAPEIVVENPVNVAGTTPPTPMQRTATPENLAAPTANVQPATAAPAPKPAKASKPKKAKKAEAETTFIDNNNVAPATGRPAPEGVVEGTSPKVSSSTNLRTQNLSTVTESSIPSRTSPTPVEQVSAPSSPKPSAQGPSEVVGKRKKKKQSTTSSTKVVNPLEKPSSPEIEFIDNPRIETAQKQFTPEELAEAARIQTAAKTPGTKQSAASLKTLRKQLEKQVVKVENVIDPATGRPVINPKTGKPAQKITYKSEAEIRAEAQAARGERRARKKAESDATYTFYDEASGQTVSTGVANTQTVRFAPDATVRRKPEITFIEEQSKTKLPGGEVEVVPSLGGATASDKSRLIEQTREALGEPTIVGRTKGGAPIYGQDINTQKWLQQRDYMKGFEEKRTSFRDPDKKPRKTLKTRTPSVTPPEQKPTKLQQVDERLKEALQNPGPFDPATGQKIDYEGRYVAEINTGYNPHLTPGTKEYKKRQKKLAEVRQRNIEIASRQKSPERIAQENAAAEARSKRSKELQEEFEQSDKPIIRFRTKRQQKQLQPPRKYPPDQGRTFNVVDKDQLLRMETYGDQFAKTTAELNRIMLEGGSARTARVEIRGMEDVLNRPVYGPELPQNPMTSFEMNPAKMDYEQLLRVEQAGFKLQVRRGAPTRYTKDRGVRGTFSHSGRGVTMEEYGNLVKSTEYTREDLLRLIQSTSGGK